MGPGWQDLIVCNGPDCTFASLILLVKAGITDLVLISTYIAVGVCMFAGFKLLTSGGNTKARDFAKNAFTKVVIGYVIIFSAWLIVYTIINALIGPNYSLLGNP